MDKRYTLTRTVEEKEELLNFNWYKLSLKKPKYTLTIDNYEINHYQNKKYTYRFFIRENALFKIEVYERSK